MIKQRDRKQQKENDVAVAGGFIKAAGAGGTAGFTPPAAISGVSLQPGFTIESEILSARVKEQEYAEYSKSLAEAAVQKERKGDFASSPTFWQEARRMDSISRDYGAKASFYEQLRYTPASAAAVMSTGGAPRPTVPGGKPATPIVQTTRSAQPRSFSGYDNTWVKPQTAPPAGDDQGVEDRVALDFDSASSTAKEAYEAYRAAQKEFDNEYGWRRNPTSHGGYGAAYGELQELKQAYLESLDFLLDNYDAFETDAGIPPPDRDRDTLQGYMNQLTEHMWDYYHENPEAVDPERIAMYIADIAALRNAIVMESEDVIQQESEQEVVSEDQTDITALERLKQIGISAGTEMLGSYTQSVATTTQWLADQNIGSTQGYIEQVEISLQQALSEREAYLVAGVAEDNPLVVQLNETIRILESSLDYIQSGQLEADRATGRQGIYDMAAGFYKQAETAQDKASEGLGTVGSFLVETGIEGCKLLADAAFGTVLAHAGIPGGALANRLVCSFGEGAYKAAEKGGGSNMQIAYGIAEAAVEYLSSKANAGSRVYDEVIVKYLRGMAKDLKSNMTIHEIVGAYSLNSLGESLVTLLKEMVDPVYEYITTGEKDMDKIWGAWDESLETFILNFTTNVVTHE